MILCQYYFIYLVDTLFVTELKIERTIIFNTHKLVITTE